VALVEGSAGLVHAPRARLAEALKFTIANAKVVRIEVIGRAARLRDLDIAVL
jgi:RNA polymerase sigma-70 factor (ECF subfamily)